MTKTELVVQFCMTPKTTTEIVDAGFSRFTIYNAVSNGKLKNLRKGEPTGRGLTGLFVEAHKNPLGDADWQRVGYHGFIELAKAWGVGFRVSF